MARSQSHQVSIAYSLPLTNSVVMQERRIRQLQRRIKELEREGQHGVERDNSSAEEEHFEELNKDTEQTTV